MRYTDLLIKEKHRLQQQLEEKENIIRKYSIPGCISKKRINGRVYRYIQFKDSCSRLRSVCITKQFAETVDHALTCRERMEKRIAGIKNSLGMLSGIPDGPVPESTYAEARNRPGFRLLANAVGISRVYNALFCLVPLAERGWYRIDFSDRGRKTSCQMTFVIEKEYGRIDSYMESASEMVDYTLAEMGRPREKVYPEQVRGVMPDGTRFRCRKTRDGYEVCFGKKPETRIPYTPLKLGDTLHATISYQADMQFLINRYRNRKVMDEAMAKYGHEAITAP